MRVAQPCPVGSHSGSYIGPTPAQAHTRTDEIPALPSPGVKTSAYTYRGETSMPRSRARKISIAGPVSGSVRDSEH